MEAHKQWKQHEQIKDMRHEAEAVRVRAVAKKEHREAVEQSRKCPHVEEVEDEADMSIECCKWCIMKGMPSLTFIFVLMAGIGLVCICKLNASCDACHDQKMKCKYPGKSGIGTGSGVGVSSGMGMSSPMKGQPIIVIPSPKHESLEV